ncbi:MAG TPA: hypothetical protein VIU29_07740 [Candidatus Deferrimicrobiaceae bacterium]
MRVIGMLAAATILSWATLAGAPCLAGEGSGRRPVSTAAPDRFASIPNEAQAAGADRVRAIPILELSGRMVMQGDPFVRETAAAGSRQTVPGRIAAVSLDRRVPAAQVTDREGLSVVGVAGVLGELRHAFSRKDRMPQPDDGGAARMVRLLRDSVFGKRISILSESGRIAENEPFLVGLSFTH